MEEAISALAAQPFVPDEFPFAFLVAFGNKATTIKRLRSGSSNKSDCGGVLQTSNIQISGTIYVLRSKSDLPIVKDNRQVLHKIGVTIGKVERRIANAKIDATFLLADVEIVATYELFNINRSKLENLIHRIFDTARLDLEIKDRFGNSVVPREWFLVPFAVVDDAVERIKDGTIKDYLYDPKQARLVERKAK
ncbi:GIY-YIG nuclease family protein [Synechococcus sp. MU1644]|nr:GIY-YIG nuclease family protein [Synechococcus sp. MU1644]